MADAEWWRDAVFYEVYVRSYSDASGDGVGDLRGITSRLDHLVSLGVDALWLTPFYPSPMADHGYDVSDPRDVDPLFGSLRDLDELVAAAHRHGLRVTVDVVPNHVSNRHPWFVAALAAPPGDPVRARFLFRDGRGPGGEQPPNNWRSTFGGPAWTRVPDGQWYLHLFAPEQPDLNWRDPQVGDDFERTLRFWLDRGVDGFRVDVAHGLFKAADLPDNPPGVEQPDLMSESSEPTPMFDQPEVHDVYRRWRRVCDSYPHRPMLVGEVWIGDARVVAQYVRPDELHLAFNFRLLFADWDAGQLAQAVELSITALREVGATPTWVLSNHDVMRHPTRYGGGDIGLRRARAALLLMLALPGPAFLYQGEELGLFEVDLPDEALQDPVWERSGHERRGRDGCRVPLPWSGSTPPYDFSPAAQATWLPQPADWAAVTVAAESCDDASVLSLYRRALALRSGEPALGDGELVWNSRGPVLDLTRPGPRGVRCMVNLGDTPIALPPGELLLASQPHSGARDLPRELPPDSAAWLRA